MVSLIITEVITKANYSLARNNIKGASAPQFNCYSEVVFEKRLILNNNLPRFLLRGKDETYGSYLKRIDQFLSNYGQKELSNLLGYIDPTVEMYKPTCDYLMTKINKKGNNCNLI